MKAVVVILCLGLTPALAQNGKWSVDQKPTSVSVLAEGLFTTQLNERDFALSPDGKEVFFTISTPKSTFQTIVYSKQIKKGEWTAPEVASFAGEYSDLEPAFSADGQTLYFASNRPVNGNEKKDFDIWKVVREGDQWGQPIHLGATINTEADEFYPSVTRTGNLYFTAAYKGGPGREDIYLSTFKNNEYQKPVPLDTAVNSRFYEFNAFVDPDEQYILFTSYGRKDDSGGGDLYLSRKGPDGRWQAAQNLTMLNSKQLDYCPAVAHGALFFTSERHQLPVKFTSSRATYKSIENVYHQPFNSTGNLYWVDFAQVLSFLKK